MSSVGGRRSSWTMDQLLERIAELEAENGALKVALATARVDAAAVASSVEGCRPSTASGSGSSSGGGVHLRPKEPSRGNGRPSHRVKPPRHGEGRGAGVGAGVSSPPSLTAQPHLSDSKQQQQHSPSSVASTSSAVSSPGKEDDVEDRKSGEEQCSNCQHMVPCANMRNHVLHCYRNIFRCPMCNVAIPVKDKRQHVDDARGAAEQVLHAATVGDVLAMEKMLSHGQDVDIACNADKESAIHIAARNGQRDFIQFLLSKGASIDRQNTRGECALHLAAASSQFFEVSAYLLSQGANTALTNAMGDTPSQIAQRHKNHEVALMMRRVGGALRPSSRGSHGRPSSARSNSSARSLASLPGLEEYEQPLRRNSSGRSLSPLVT